MAKRLPASMRTREELSSLIEGRLASPAGRSALVELATRLIVEEALEGEARDTLGRDYYEHGAEPGHRFDFSCSRRSRRPEARNAGNVLRAGPPPPLLPASGDQWRQLAAITQNQRPDTGRPADLV